MYSRYEVRLGKMLSQAAATGLAPAPYLRNVNIQWDRVDLTDLPEMDFTEAERRTLALRPGDLLVCEGGEVGRAALWCGEIEGCYYQKAVHRVRPLRPSDECVRFLLYTLYAAAKMNVFAVEGNRSTIVHLTGEKLRRHRFAYPGCAEQRAIATFLDRETAKLDALLAKKRALIELLKEKRSALISRTVTRGLPPDAARAAGLNPHPKLRPSGVEWIGEVPEHWDVKRLKFIARLQTGPFGSQLHASDYVAGGAPIVNPSHLSNGCILPDPDITADEDTRMRLSRHVLGEGDIVLARRGEMGRCALVTEREGGWLCGSGSMRIRVEGLAMYAPLLAWALSTRGIQESLLLSSVGTTMDNLNREIVGAVSIPIPEIPEQHAIADYLDREAGRLDQMAARVEKAVERLQEYRAALITAAVTGKIDLRGADIGASF